MKSSLTVQRMAPGKLDSLRSKMNQIQQMDVYVGIPADKTLRKEDEINNASLAFIMEHGSPLRNIPARPFLKPGIATAKALISKELAEAAKSVIADSPLDAEKHLKRAGIIGANAVKRYIREGDNLAPNAPSTIMQKESDRPLIDTGQLVKAITSVVAGKDQESQ